MMELYPKCRRIETKAELESVQEAMKADGHSPFPWLTHLVERGGQVVGAASLGAAPLVMVWNHRGLTVVRESLHLQRIYESIMETKGCAQYLIGCDRTSPYSALMEKGGFKPVWETQLFMGGVKA
jgi:hypothetical protein